MLDLWDDRVHAELDCRPSSREGAVLTVDEVVAAFHYL
jgi:hypothetical protein